MSGCVGGCLWAFIKGFIFAVIVIGLVSYFIIAGTSTWAH